MFAKARDSLSHTLSFIEKCFGFKNEIKWVDASIIILYHLLGAYWCYHYAFPAKWKTVVFAIFMYYFTGMGVISGVHRYWTHNSFKATLPVQVLLLTCYTCAGQNTISQWVRDHRVHHKYSDTEADPHNANRGFFFSHIGWLMTKKNDEVIRRGKEIDLSDITNNRLLQWHEKYFSILKLMLCFVLPTVTGIYLWNEDWKCAVAWQCFIRYLSVFHAEFTVNSFAHFYGYRPYNKNILPSENWFVSVLTGGDGWHNYHHAFPFDYKAAEFGHSNAVFTRILNLFARLGLVYDLREATPAMVSSMAQRQGDGTPTLAMNNEASNSAYKRAVGRDGDGVREAVDCELAVEHGHVADEALPRHGALPLLAPQIHARRTRQHET